MSNLSSRNLGTWLAMCAATVALTLAVAFTLWPPASRDASFQLSLAMLCLAECVTFLVPALQMRGRADTRAPGFLFTLAFQATIGIYAAGVVVLCCVAAIPDGLSFHWLVLLHAGWLALLFLRGCTLSMASGFVNDLALGQGAGKAAFQQVRQAVNAFASGVAQERDGTWAPLAAQAARLKDDADFSAPETLAGTESFNDRLMAALEHLANDLAAARSAGAPAAAMRIQGLVDQARAVGALLRERNDAVRAAR